MQGERLKHTLQGGIDMIRSGLARVSVAELDTIIKLRSECASGSRLNAILDREVFS